MNHNFGATYSNCPIFKPRTARKVHTFADFVAMLESAVNGLAPHLAPNDDWATVVHMVNAAGELRILGIDPRFMADDRSKDALVDDVLPRIFAETHAKMASIIFTCWLSASTSAAFGIMRPKDDPEHTEAVLIHCFSANDTSFALANIQRAPNTHPTLGPWQHFPHFEFAGRFATLADALRLIHATNA